MRRWILQFDRELSRRRGSMLILALAVLALLASFVFHAQVKARARLMQTGTDEARLRLRLAVTDSVIHALQVLADDDDLRVDHLKEPWAKPIDLETPDGIGVVITFKDAQQKFDLNNLYTGEAPPQGRPAEDVLGDLFTYCGDFQPSQKISAAADWIDPDQEGVKELDDYKEAGLKYPPANRLALALGEVIHMHHFSRELFERREFERRGSSFHSDLIDEISILPVARTQAIPVNLNTCSISAMRALVGLSENSIAESIIVARNEQPIRSLAPFGVVLTPVLQRTLQEFADVRSQYFEIHANGYFQGATIRMIGLAERSGDGTVQIIKWVM